MSLSRKSCLQLRNQQPDTRIVRPRVGAIACVLRNGTPNKPRPALASGDHGGGGKPGSARSRSTHEANSSKTGDAATRTKANWQTGCVQIGDLSSVFSWAFLGCHAGVGPKDGMNGGSRQVGWFKKCESGSNASQPLRCHIVSKSPMVESDHEGCTMRSDAEPGVAHIPWP